MKLGFTTLGCPDWTLAQVAENAAKMGFDGVELRTHPDGNHFSLTASAQERKDARALFEKAGSRVFSIMAYTKFAVPDEAERAKNVADLKAAIQLASDLGADRIRSFVGKIAAGEDRAVVIERAAKAIAECAKDAEKAGVHIGFETHDDWCDAANLKLLMEKIGSPSFGVVWDFFNAYTATGQTIAQTFEAVKPYVKYCHAKDGVKGADGKWNYVLPGTGHVPIKEVVACLKSIKFDGFLSFEHEKKWHPELPPPEEAFPKYVEYMRGLIGGTAGGAKKGRKGGGKKKKG